MKIPFVFLAILLCIWACTNSSEPIPTSVPVPVGSSVPAPDPRREPTKTYLSLGDSYTIGESVAENERWSVQLVEILNANNLGLKPPEIIARTGWTTYHLKTTLKASPPQLKNYDMVSMLIGVNNQYRGESKTIFREDFRELLQLCIGYAGGNKQKVFVLTIPDWGTTPFASGVNKQSISSDIESFNIIIKDEARSAGVPIVELFDLSQFAASDASMVAVDRLHFSGKMYRLWANRAFDVARLIVK
jgi:lysophospholipase L1-like esterase